METTLASEIDLLLDQLNSPYAGDRRMAASKLGNLGCQDERVRSALEFVAMNDQDSFAQSEARYALEALGYPHFLPEQIPSSADNLSIPASSSETEQMQAYDELKSVEEEQSILTPQLPEQILAIQMHNSIRSWALFSLFWGGLSLIASNIFDALWGGILIIVGILAWKIKVPAMFIIFSVIMGWAAITNGLSALDGTESWWLVLALLQIWWTYSIVKQFRRYRHLHLQEMVQAGTWPIQLPPPQDQVVISDRFAKTGGILAGILFMLVCTFLGSFVFIILSQTEETPGWIDLLLSGVVDVSLLALSLSLAALLTNTRKKTFAWIGAGTSILGLAAFFTLVLLGVLLG